SSRARVSLFQLRQERVQIEQLFDRKCGDPAYALREGHPLLFAASLFSNSGAGMIDENTPHRLSCDGKEVSSVLVRDRLPAENAQVQLVHHGAGFARMIPTLPLQETRGDLAQLRVHHREQRVARLRIALPPPGEQAADFYRVRKFCHERASGMILGASGARY